MLLFIKPYALLFIIIVLIISLIAVSIVCILLYAYRTRESERFSGKKLLDSSNDSEVPDTTTGIGHSIPLKKLQLSSIPSTPEKPPKIICETAPHFSFHEYSVDTPTNYQTFDFAKRYQSHVSSDSSYTSSTKRYGQISFDSVKSKFQQKKAHQRLSVISLFNQQQKSKEQGKSPVDSENEHNPRAPTLSTITSEQHNSINDSSSTEHLHISNYQPPDDRSDSDIDQTPTRLSPKLNINQLNVSSYAEYTLSELFRIELRYFLYYDLTQNELRFQLVQLQHLHSIEKCFRTFICKIRLHIGQKHSRRGRRYFSKMITKDVNSNQYQSNELFRFQLDQHLVDEAYLKVSILGYQKNERIELGQTLLILNEHEKSVDDGNLEEYRKFVQIYEDKIDLITQLTELENEARALICLVYENERGLLHVGIIKATGIPSLLKHQHGLVHIKVCTVCDNKVMCKKKSKPIPKIHNDTVFTFSTSFDLDYLSLHKTCVRISICLKPTPLTTSKLVGKIEFGSNCLKNVVGFQHWTDTLSAPNKPHIGWHTFEKMNQQK
ncbi:unnamed protein product [Didymodactylos carnosus]|uniref:Uncharacterized protein n=1 Tax=Didymodactylos carnosus TaxID=1234261 RepID=A0A814Y6A7_9BILA|nr:unnamed protein product [Didymodactylos carnosus]CAF1225007.1 unnamed protein product [Didymodactylos carnosus]CAF3795926.1 unnamed protein product [Didymodactylos carnosus]CAF3987965.1 unnamed protein product [Didymodactylos carnosus]